MANWYSYVSDNTKICTSDSGYINGDLALEYLDQLIQFIDAGPKKPPKLLLMDRHGSHMDPRFIIKATDNNIHPFPFPGHLTHILQPLDVAIFQPYKHWHQKAVQYANRGLDIEYTIASFLRDLSGIREKTFKKTTIVGAFRKSGMWPIRNDKAQKKLLQYSPPTPLDELELPIQSQEPKRYHEVEYGIGYWQDYMHKKDLWSSPTRKRDFDAFVHGTKTLAAGGELVTLQNTQFEKRINNQLIAKTRSRQSIQKNGVLTGKEAREKLLQQEKDRTMATKNWMFKTVRKERNRITKALYIQGVAARKEEKARKLRLEKLQRLGEFVPIELYTPIPDPEKDTTEEELKEQVGIALLKYEQFSDGIYDYEAFKAEERQRKEEKERDSSGNKEESDDEDEDIEIVLRNQLLDSRWVQSTNEELTQFLEGDDDELRIYN